MLKEVESHIYSAVFIWRQLIWTCLSEFESGNMEVTVSFCEIVYWYIVWSTSIFEVSYIETQR